MAQIENITKLMLLSATARTITHPAEDIHDREERVRRAGPYMGICHAPQASPWRHGYEACGDLAAEH